MNDLQLLIDLHRHAYRQGPGSDETTANAIALAGIDRSAPLEIADIGCGTGASTLVLARALNARITAIDFLQDFLDVLDSRARQEGVDDKITSVCAGMDALPLKDETLDVIWAEGAIYNIGFANGVSAWKRFLKPGGLLVVSEITWLTRTRPADIEAYWHNEYPEIGLASSRIGVLEDSGYSPAGYFVLPEQCWLEHYYRPMQARFDDFLGRHGNSDAACAIVEAERREIALYETGKAYYSYGMYLARKI